MPAFQPYWGKPAVRNDREDRGNVGIIRSPIRASIPPDLSRHQVIRFGVVFRGHLNEADNFAACMKETVRQVNNEDFLLGGGEMGALMRSHDWMKTPLGTPHEWPQSLKTAVRLLLTTQHPMFIW